MRWLSAPFRWYRSAYFGRPWLFIFVTFILCEVLAFAYLIQSPKNYTASAIIMPIVADKPDQRLLGNDSAQGAVSSLLFGQKAVPPEFDRFMQTLASTSLAQRLLQNPDFVQALFVSEWNPDTKSWQQPPGTLSSIRATMAKVFGLPPYSPPNVDRIQKAIDDRIKMKAGVASNSQVLTYDDRDPQRALYVLRTVIAENDMINREQIADQISGLIGRINTMLSTTTDLTMRDSLIPLLVEQRRRQLAVQGDVPFAIDVIDPPRVSTDPTSPRPFLVLLAIGAFSIFAAGSAVMLRMMLHGLGGLAEASR